MQEGSRKAIVAALAANVGIAVAKFVGYAMSGATSMLAEAVHSVADSGNQGLLFLGASRAQRPESEERPFGYSRERYFWAFVVALVIFLLGGAFAIYEGFHKLRSPEPLDSPLIAITILAVSIVLEGWSFYTAFKEARASRGELGWVQYYKSTKSAELPVILLEDLGALVGLLMAFVGIGMAMVTHDSRWDALGSIAIGLLLTAIAITLSIKMRSLLVGEAASERDLSLLQDSLLGSEHVRRVLHMRTNHIGPDKLLVAAKVEFESGLTIEDICNAINVAEVRMRDAVPSARYIYIEPDLPK